MGKRFGTDGVRGVANVELTPELAFSLGRAGAYVLAKHKTGRQPIRLLVGKDTRISGDMLESALTAGILSVGADAYWAGILPTPAVAWLTAQQGMEAGAMISASHNPAADNGIKFFSSDGYKLPDAIEEEIEFYLDHPEQLPRPAGDKVGRVYQVSDWQELYVDYLASLARVPLQSMRIVVDCANGAAYKVAPQLFTRLGAQVAVINAEPDGRNINVSCGSTHPQGLAQLVQAHAAHLGLAFDGDADRLIAVDHQGRVVDGDVIMAICALDLAKKGCLTNNTLVATVMSNLGLEKAMQAAGIQLLRTKVGDRYVLAKMQEVGACLGGEQSGHIILADYATTGDGLLTALQLVQIVAESGRSLADLASAMQPYPQVLRNVRTKDKSIVGDRQVQQVMAQAEQDMQGKGRLLVRPSGTEPLIRVMAEAETQAMADQAVRMVVQSLEKAIGE